MIFPESLTPATRLNLDSTKSPMVPMALKISAITIQLNSGCRIKNFAISTAKIAAIRARLKNLQWFSLEKCVRKVCVSDDLPTTKAKVSLAQIKMKMLMMILGLKLPSTRYLGNQDNWEDYVPNEVNEFEEGANGRWLALNKKAMHLPETNNAAKKEQIALLRLTSK
jgi:hypothetical protein